MSAATTLPAIKGQMGSTEFFQSVMTAQELAGIAITASELPEWETQSIFERMQRAVNYPRVRKEMVPYLLNTSDRFFGSLMLLVLDSQYFGFHPLPAGAIEDQPHALKEAYAPIGTVTITRGCRIVALDGQHRLLTLREVLLSDEYREDARALRVGADRLSVTFIRFENLVKTRRLFSKVNSHAKPTTHMDNIVTSEDDGNAIVTRWLLEPEPPADLAASPISKWARGMDAGIIDFRKLNCTQSDATLYSLKTIYEAVRTILAVNGTEDFDEKRRIVRPSDLELRAAYGVCVKWWATLLAASPALLKINVDQRQVVREKRSDSEQSLLMTQMGLLACIRAASLIRDRSDAADELIALEAVASLSWQRSDDRWRGILINNAGGMISNQGNIRIAARLQAMRAAPNRWSEEEKLQLQAEVRELRADPRWTLSLN